MQTKHIYVFTWFVLGLIVTLVDWIDHVLRPGQAFMNFPIAWLAYSILSLLTCFFTIIGFNYILSFVIRWKMLKEIISLVCGLFIFQLAGPVINKMTISEIKLSFKIDFKSTLIAIVIYTILYFIINYFLQRKNEKISDPYE